MLEFVYWSEFGTHVAPRVLTLIFIVVLIVFFVDYHLKNPLSSPFVKLNKDTPTKNLVINVIVCGPPTLAYSVWMFPNVAKASVEMLDLVNSGIYPTIDQTMLLVLLILLFCVHFLIFFLVSGISGKSLKLLYERYFG